MEEKVSVRDLVAMPFVIVAGLLVLLAIAIGGRFTAQLFNKRLGRKE